jgi:hypothetical protein
MASNGDFLIFRDYVSKMLTHFVGKGRPLSEQYDILKKILRTGWLTHAPHRDHPSLGTAIHPDRRFTDNEMINPDMICFCDIPLASQRIHTRKYGEFGIAFPKQWLAAQGANPVHYVARGSGVYRRKPELRKAQLPRTTVPLEKYADLATEPARLEDFELEPRGRVFDEHMIEFWELWREKVRLQEDSKPEVAALASRDLQMMVFLVTQIFGFMKTFDETLPDEHPENYYMEREWRRLGNLRFEPANVAAILVPLEFAKLFVKDCPDYADRLRLTAH